MARHQVVCTRAVVGRLILDRTIRFGAEEAQSCNVWRIASCEPILAPRRFSWVGCVIVGGAKSLRFSSVCLYRK